MFLYKLLLINEFGIFETYQRSLCEPCRKYQDLCNEKYGLLATLLILQEDLILDNFFILWKPEMIQDNRYILYFHEKVFLSTLKMLKQINRILRLFFCQIILIQLYLILLEITI